MSDRCAYRKILKALDEAQGLFHLGRAGGIAFCRGAGARLAGGYRLSCPLFPDPDYFETEERSIRFVQDFGRRIARRGTEEIRVPTSYAINRALVIESHAQDQEGQT